MRIANVMTSNVECAAPEMTLQTAGRLMAQHDVGSLPVVQHHEPIGIVTDRDIVVRTIAAGFDPSETRVEQVMSRDAAFCHPEDDVDDAATLMEQRRIRRLLVVDNDGCVCGIVSLGDLAVRNVSRKLLKKCWNTFPGRGIVRNRCAAAAPARPMADVYSTINAA